MFVRLVQIYVHFKTRLKKVAGLLYFNFTGNLSVKDCSVWVSGSRGNKAVGKANSARNLEPDLLKEW